MGISGSYDGEGPNVAAVNYSAGAPGPVAASPDIPLQTNAKNNANNGGQGREGMCRVDRRGRLRNACESARNGAAISVGGGDQVLNVYARYLYISVAGNVVCRLADDTADINLVNLAAGVMYPLAISVIRQSGTTASGLVLF